MKLAQPGALSTGADSFRWVRGAPRLIVQRKARITYTVEPGDYGIMALAGIRAGAVEGIQEEPLLAKGCKN